ncbi:uncharacterized protein LOC122377530 [Amphibalanus amphitrite]|uniref:uncharacterized protein LOC122377530 n=1 Tax=Amphibalanus amphitrite TaxID=1232801 RepID=UPI001C91EB5D|nr:uncharacterized protein LOC122377530 [Amphibalanus amphitrite]
MAVTTMLCGWLLLLMVTNTPNIAHCSAPPTDPGHLFIPLGKTYPSYSSWAITLSISMKPYRKDVRRINDATNELSRTARTLLANHSPPTNATAADPAHASLTVSLKHLSHSIDQLQTEENHLVDTFRDLLSIPEARSSARSANIVRRTGRSKRVKRGLIDGIGSVMSSLFGTATESEIKHLDRNVQLINTKEVAMAHAFNGTLNVINSTRVATTQNRKALRTLQTAMSSMSTSHLKLIRAADNAEALITVSLRVADLAENVRQVTRSLNHLYTSLVSLSSKLALAQVGILHADLIQSRDLNRVLRKVSKSLPAHFALPFPPSATRDYVRIVKTKLIPVDDAFHVLFYIPLLHTLHAFDVYRFFPYQVPLHSHNISLLYVPNEPRYLVVSENRQQYIQPVDSEIEACLLIKQPFCPLHEPAYSTANADSCVVALFRQDELSISRLCAPIVRPTNDAPKAHYLSRGTWLLVSRPPLSITVVCPYNSTTISITKSVHLLTLPMECSASSDSLYLPPYYASETHLDFPDFNDAFTISNDSSSIPIWRSHWTSAIPIAAQSNSSLIPTLHVDGMPADDYFNRVEALPLEQVIDDTPSAFSYTWLLIIIISVLATCCMCFCIKHCFPRSLANYRLPRFVPASAVRDIREPAIEMDECRHALNPPAAPPGSLQSIPEETAVDATASTSETLAATELPRHAPFARRPVVSPRPSPIV